MKEPNSTFHAGEQSIQSKMGVRERAENLGSRMIRPYMPLQHRQFFCNLPYLFVGSIDEQGRPWASMLFSDSTEFIHSPDETHLVINSQQTPGDPLFQTLDIDSDIGVLGIELSTRRRNRMSGKVSKMYNDSFELAVKQSFGNCPQYIQHRELSYIKKEDRKPSTFKILTELDERAINLINQSDTFFVASYFSDDSNSAYNGADVSHRGGKPGFVRIDNQGQLTIPDYAGNNHFNTLGNLHKNPKAGLLFVDFTNGHMLSLTGSTEIIWQGDDVEHFNGAHLCWRFKIEQVNWMENVLPFRFVLKEFSPNSLLTGDWQEAENRRLLEQQKNTWKAAKVENIVTESDGIKSFYLQPHLATTEQYDAGQFLTVKSTQSNQIRTYSLSSSPDDKQYRISVKREENGHFSQLLHDKVKIGDSLSFKSPAGGFTIKTKRPVVLIAAGIGVTPFVSMLRQALTEMIKSRKYQPITLFFQVRNTNTSPFFNELNQISAKSEGMLRVIWSMSQPAEQDIEGKDYHYAGHIDNALLQQVLAIDDYEFFVCGPSTFTQQQYNNLRALGVADQRIITEAFGPSSLVREKPLSESIADSFKTAEQALITFEQSQVEQAWSKQDGNLLNFAEQHGLTPEFGCRNGQCGSCKVTVNEGELIHDKPISFPLGKNEALLCCAVPAHQGERIPTINLEM